MKRFRQSVAAVCTAVMLVLMLPLSASATTGYPEHYLTVVTEPEYTSEYVKYFKNGEETPLEQLPWVDGGLKGGKALDLNGKNTYLQIGEEQLRTSQFTFATWLKFRGSADPENPSAAYNQRLFTIGDETDCYFTVSPHAVHDAITDEKGSLNGVFMEYVRLANTEDASNVQVRLFDGCEKGVSHFGLPQNEWHHMAVVFESMAVKLYIDGNLIFKEDILIPVAQMSALYMNIGSGLWNDPTLNALIDDMILFDTLLTQEQVAALMQSGLPKESLNAPATLTTTGTVYMPTTTTVVTTTTAPVSTDAERPEAPFGLPLWGFGVCVGLVGVIVILTVIVNSYEIRRRRREQTSQAGEEEHHDED